MCFSFGCAVCVYTLLHSICEWNRNLSNCKNVLWHFSLIASLNIHLISCIEFFRHKQQARTLETLHGFIRNCLVSFISSLMVVANTFFFRCYSVGPAIRERNLRFFFDVHFSCHKFESKSQMMFETRQSDCKQQKWWTQFIFFFVCVGTYWANTTVHTERRIFIEMNNTQYTH